MENNIKTKIISVVNQKGGVGKTTTVINIATVFSALNKKVLIIDFDPQSNASSGIGLSLKDREKHDIYNLLIEDRDVNDLVYQTKILNLYIIPCTVNLAGAEVELTTIDNREFRLKNQLSKLQEHFDYIFIDCPPSLSLLTINALVASTSIIIPLQCEFFALEGLSHLLDTAERVRDNFNSELTINGIILTMYDKRNKLTEQVEQDVRQCLGEMVYETVIPRNVKLSESPSHGIPAIIYDSTCPGSVAYMKLAEEMVKRI